jgi:uncharacterized protein YcsI (UPF0317 family)
MVCRISFMIGSGFRFEAGLISCEAAIRYRNKSSLKSARGRNQIIAARLSFRS